MYMYTCLFVYLYPPEIPAPLFAGGQLEMMEMGDMAGAGFIRMWGLIKTKCYTCQTNMKAQQVPT